MPFGTGVVVGLANHTLLLAKDGSKRLIDDSAAPILDAAGVIAGVVLVFRDISERRRHEHAAREALRYAEEIIATLREPFLVLDRRLHVKTANTAFYREFHVSGEETVGRFVYELGNGQWDIPALRMLLEVQVPEEVAVHDFEVEHDFPDDRTQEHAAQRPAIPAGEDDNPDPHPPGHRGRDRPQPVGGSSVKDSELRYRRLFQTAKDGILILDAETGQDPRRQPVHERIARLRAR